MLQLELKQQLPWEPSQVHREQLLAEEVVRMNKHIGPQPMCSSVIESETTPAPVGKSK